MADLLGFFKKIERGVKLPLFLVLFIGDLIYVTVSSFIVNTYDPNLLDVHPKQAFFTDFLISVVFGPLLETFLFQFLIIEVLSRFKANTNLIIFISAFVFGLIHDYNLVYIFLTFFSGILYAAYYLYLKQENKPAFRWVWLLHGLGNFAVITLDYFDI